MLKPDSIVGSRYKVVRPLGGGGMKLVYLAEDLRLASRSCALAEMVDSFTNPDTQRQAVAGFQREADMLAQLNNEHIPRIFDRFSEQNRHYLVMEYVDGATLEDALKRAGGKLDEQRVIDIALQVLDTLIYLHGLSPPVVYRDLKPSNVMLTSSGQIKLIDFGIARHFQPFSNATMIGTQGYAPPEQYRGKVETRSDIYALGATMHHALSGRDPALEPPFSFPPLRSACPDVAPALATLIDEALSYDVERRPASASDFKRRLMEIKAGAMSAPSASVRASSPPPSGHFQPSTASSGASSAPTVLSNATEIVCPACRKHIPTDSRFCGFCQTDLRRHLGPDEVVSSPEADTADLQARAPRSDSRRGAVRAAGRLHRLQRPRVLIPSLLALLLIGYLVTSLIAYIFPYESSAPAPGPEGEMVPGPEPGPEGVEPKHSSPQAIRLRQMLNQQGYGAVHFRIDGDTIELWGTVPTWADRMMVQATVFAVTGIVSVQDHLKVREDEFGFGGP
jgi:serine/threonine protein kinase